MEYGKKYTATIASRENETLQADIYVKGYEGDVSELTLAWEKPITIEYDMDDGLFKPLKMSACTVSVLTDEPLWDLYTGTLNGVQLRLYRDGTLIWFGFLTPNVYSSEYATCQDQLDLEFVDPLSAMENCKFAYFDKDNILSDDTPSEHFFASFWQYMLRGLHCVGALDDVTKVVIKGSCGIDITTTGCMQRNFIDETDDEDDGAMTWQEVMESIAQYLNMTFCIYGDTLYYIDSLATGTEAKSLATIGIAEGNGSISLGEVYNKVTVVANNNELDGAIPDPLEDDDLVAEETNPKYHTVKYVAGQYQYNEQCAAFKENDDTTIYKLMNAAFTSNKWDTALQYRLDYTVAVAALSSWGVAILTEPPTSEAISIVPWGDTEYNDGMMEYKATEDGGDIYYCLEKTHVLGSFMQRYCSVETDGVTSSLDWHKCLTLGSMVGRTNRPNVAASVSIKDEACPQFVGQGGYLILSVKFIMSYWAYPQSVCQQQEIDANDDLPLALTCTLKIGNYYYTRDSKGNGSWSTTPGTFQIKHTCDDDKYQLGTEVSIDNEVSWDLGLNVSDEGYLIKLPIDFILNGKIEFTIQNDEPNEKHVQPTYYHITELSLQYATSSTIEDIFNMEEYDADITYTGYIDADNVSEMDDVEFTTNTYTDRATSYSYAMSNASGSYTYITSPVQEQECIKRLVNYYSKAKMQYQNTVNDKKGAHLVPWDNWEIPAFSDRTFTTGSVTFNLAEDSADITLVEI